MQRFRWPGFEMRLLGELQRQQNSSQFCDTLLQTDGISVPTHSCLLAALSPCLSRKLLASPSPPPGQKHRLQLQAVKAQTLLKLVGLLYSGELEVKGSTEQSDVLALAHQLGIPDLIGGQKEGGMGVAEPHEETGFNADQSGMRRARSRKLEDAQVQAKMAQRRDRDSAAEKRSCISTGTQTVKAGEKSAPSVCQSLEFSALLQPQNSTLDKDVCPTSCPVTPSMSIGTPNNGKSSFNQLEYNPKSTPALSSELLTLPLSVSDSNSPRYQGDQQLSEFVDSFHVLVEDWTDLDNVSNEETANNRRYTEQPSQLNTDELEERRKSTATKHAQINVGKKNLAKMKQMQQMVESAQISVKVKLKRRTKGEVWEVTNAEHTDENLSVLNLKQAGFNHKKTKTNASNVTPTPSSVQTSPLDNSDSHFLKPLKTISNKSPPQPKNSSDSKAPSSDCLTPNLTSGLEASPLLQRQASAEESDEQIEKLLEDIMMGLNILPNLERDCKSSHSTLPSHDGIATICQVPVTQKDTDHGQIRSAVGSPGCVFYQDYGIQDCNSSKNADFQCLTSQDQPSCSGSSSVLLDAAQGQEFSSQCHTSVRSLWQRDGMNHQSMPLSKKIRYPAFQESSALGTRHNLGFLPLNRNETQAMHTHSLPYMADYQLPQCLSPLTPCTSTSFRPSLINPTTFGNKTQPQPSLHGRSWLTENPRSLHILFSTLRHRKHLEPNEPSRGPLAESFASKSREEREKEKSGEQRVPEHRSEPRKLRKCDDKGDATAPKRMRPKRTTFKQNTSGSVLASKVNLSSCQVSLSSNNVLANERERVANASNITSKIVGKTDRPLSLTKIQRGKTRLSGVDSDRTQIRTRSSLKKTKESPNETSQENDLVAKPEANRAFNKQAVQCRKRGRPPKHDVEELKPSNDNPAFEKKSHNGGHQQRDTLPKGDLQKKDDKLKQRCKKRRMEKSTNVELLLLKKTPEVERNGEAEAGIHDMFPDARELAPKRPRMGILEEFQKLIKRQHLKTKKSEQCHNTDAIGRAAKGEILHGSTDEPTKSQRDDCSIRKETDFFGGKGLPLFDTTEEKVTMLAAEKEQTRKSPDEGTTCDTGMMNTALQAAVQDESSCCCPVPQDNNLHPQMPELTGPPMSDTVGISKTTVCEEEKEEEDEEDVEVDVLLSSPAKVQTKVVGPQLEIIPDEEEEEDANEIDVTGE